METLAPPPFYGHTIFCDDIRHEAGGKVSFVGVYSNSMVVHGAFPCLLPKFGLWIQYNQRRDSVVAPVRFAIFLPGDKADEPSIITQIPDETVEQAIQNSTDLSKTHPLNEKKHPSFVGLGNHTIFSPFVIAQPGLIMVRAIRDDKLVRLGSLRVMAAPAASA